MSSSVFRPSSRLLRSLALVSQKRTVQCVRSELRNYLAPHNARSFSSTRSAWASLAQQRPPTQRAVLIRSPSPQDLGEGDDEIDVDLIPPKDARIEISDRAAEQLRVIAKRENRFDAALRISVESGGCHGYQYKMELAVRLGPDDYHFSHPTIRPANIVVDAVSMTLLNGSTIDFATELIGSSFRILDNPHSQGSGCGCGVSWELKI